MSDVLLPWEDMDDDSYYEYYYPPPYDEEELPENFCEEANDDFFDDDDDDRFYHYGYDVEEENSLYKLCYEERLNELAKASDILGGGSNRSIGSRKIHAVRPGTRRQQARVAIEAELVA